LLNKFLSLHILTINCVINCPQLFLDILNFIVEAERGAERAVNRVERSGEWELQKNDGVERCAEREVGAGTEQIAGVTGWSAELTCSARFSFFSCPRFETKQYIENLK